MSTKRRRTLNGKVSLLGVSSNMLMDRNMIKKKANSGIRSEQYMSILGGVDFSINPVVNEYISDCLNVLGQVYLLQLLDPWETKNTAIQNIGYIGQPSNLYTEELTLDFETSTQSTSTNTAIYGYVAAQPSFMYNDNTVSTVFGTTSESTSVAVSNTHTGVSSSNFDGPFASTDFAINTRMVRPVAFAIRIKNTSQRDYQGGNVYGLRTPYNNTGSGLTYSDLSEFETSLSGSFDDEWYTLFWIPRDEDDFKWTVGDYANYGIGCLQAHVRGVDGTTPSQIHVECIGVYEVCGSLETNTTCYARDQSQLWKVLNLLSMYGCYKGGHMNYKYCLGF